MAEPEILNPEDEVAISPVTNAGMDAATRSEINMQVQFAMDHPRKVETVRKEVEALVTLNPAVAEESFYTLKRKDKDGTTKLIQGPSIRFAEVLAYCWKHTRSAIQIVDVDAEFVTGEGTFMDLERNNIVKIRTKRRITDKNGRRYNTDMIQTTGNAAASLAYRNAVTRGIPQALWKDIFERAKTVAVGGTDSIAAKRTKALEYGAKIGVTADQIFNTLGIQGINDIGVDELIALRGLFNSLKDGETTIEEAFGDPHEQEVQGLMDQLGWNAGRRKMVLESYKGRSVELIAYLREQIKPLQQSEAGSTDAPQQAEAQTSQKRTRRKKDSATTETKEPQPEVKEEKQTEPEPNERTTPLASGMLDF